MELAKAIDRYVELEIATMRTECVHVGDDFIHPLLAEENKHMARIEEIEGIHDKAETVLKLQSADLARTIPPLQDMPAKSRLEKRQTAGNQIADCLGNRPG
jgi:hypothetical protein